MIKATELRVFNIVSWKGSVDTVVAIELDQDGDGYFITLSDSLRGGIATVNVNDIEPIPLTTEKLERFGFSKCTGNTGKVVYKFPVGRMAIYQVVNSNEWVIGVFDYDGGYINLCYS